MIEAVVVMVQIGSGIFLVLLLALLLRVMGYQPWESLKKFFKK